MKKKTEILSKYLSYVLRHNPSEIGLHVDKNGWAEVSSLIKGLRGTEYEIDLPALLHIIESSDKKRFTLSVDNQQIRAAQGHSIDVDLNLPPSPPPGLLYHGTAKKYLDAILAEGIKPQKRQKVHLSPTLDVAMHIGQRHGKPIVFTVMAAEMASDGYLFWKADNGVWLADAISPKYIHMNS